MDNMNCIRDNRATRKKFDELVKKCHIELEKWEKHNEKEVELHKRSIKILEEEKLLIEEKDRIITSLDALWAVMDDLNSGG